MKHAFFLLFQILFLLPLHLLAQPGTNDPTFNTIDNGNLGGGFNSDVVTTCLQPDGKIIAAGSFTIYKGISYNRIIRLNTDGSIDNSFAVGTGFDAGVNTVVVQPDGKIVVGGNFANFNGTPAGAIVRLMPDGSLDATFNTLSGTGFTYSPGILGKIRTISLQSDGKMIVGGEFLYYNGSNIANLIRLNANGSIDGTFNSSGALINSFVWTTAIQPDGKILVGGDFLAFNGVTQKYILRLNTDGTADATFNTGSYCNGKLRSIAIQPDGKIVIAGYFTSYNGVARNSIARLNADASLDLSFNPGTGFNTWVSRVALQADGKILAGGGFLTFNGSTRNGIVRINSDGSLDAGYNPYTGSSSYYVWSFAVQPNGKIIFGGSFNSVNGVYSYKIARIEEDGSLDVSFNPLNGANHTVYTTTVQSDGKIIVGGEFTSFNTVQRNRIARLFPDGALDPAFDPGSGFNSAVKAVAVQPDGKILAGGQFTQLNGLEVNRIVRLNNDGTQDNSFNSGSGFDGTVQAILIQSDGQIVVGGSFTTYNGSPVNRIVRLNADGTLDAGFTTGTGFNGTVYAISQQSNNKLILGGSFTNFNGTTRNKICRLNADGSLDASFNSTAGYTGDIYSLDIQTDGKTVIGGSFANSSYTRIFLSRVNVNGTEDFTFNPPTPENVVYAVKIQSTGKVVVGGLFNTPNAGGPGRKRIMRINSTGTLDLIFNPGVGFNKGAVNTISLQPDGMIIAAGSFDTLSGIPRSRIARLISDCPLIVTNAQVVPVSCFLGNNGSIDLAPSGGFGTYTFNWGGGIISEDRTGLTAGNYSVTITDSVGCTATQMITITQPAGALSGSTQIAGVSCFGDSTGSIDVTAAGGTLPYSYSWNDGLLNEDRTDLSSGSYSVIITDNNGCSVTVNATVNQPSQPLSVTSVNANVACYEDTTGVIDLTVTGGTLPYSFDWGSGITTEDRFDLTEGNYSVVISDANNCTQNYAVQITQPLQPLTVALSVINSSCFGGNSGAIDVSVSGGGTPYVFDWGSGVTDEDLSNLSAGSYTVHVTDNYGCSRIQDVVISEPAAIETYIDISTCDSYEWYGNTYTTNGVYPEVLTAANGCDSTVFLNLTINNSSVNTLNEITCTSYTLNGQTYTNTGTYQQSFTNSDGCDSLLVLNLIIESPIAMTVTDDSEGMLSASAADNYQWINCTTGEVILGATSQTLIVSENGNYAVLGTNETCSDTSDCITVDYIGLFENALLNFSIDPNPATDNVTILFDGMVADMMIRDAQGKSMGVRQITSGEIFSMQEFSAGVYFFEIRTIAGWGLKRVVKN